MMSKTKSESDRDGEKTDRGLKRDEEFVVDATVRGSR